MTVTGHSLKLTRHVIHPYYELHIKSWRSLKFNTNNGLPHGWYNWGMVKDACLSIYRGTVG